jgi:hypothetical protein
MRRVYIAVEERNSIKIIIKEKVVRGQRVERRRFNGPHITGPLSFSFFSFFIFGFCGEICGFATSNN